jgi:hypothetical protein
MKGYFDLFRYNANIFQINSPGIQTRWFAHLWHDDEPLDFSGSAKSYTVMVRMVRDYFKKKKVSEYGYTINIQFRPAWKHAVVTGYSGPPY